MLGRLALAGAKQNGGGRNEFAANLLQVGRKIFRVVAAMIFSGTAETGRICSWCMGVRRNMRRAFRRSRFRQQFFLPGNFYGKVFTPAKAVSMRGLFPCRFLLEVATAPGLPAAVRGQTARLKILPREPVVMENYAGTIMRPLRFRYTRGLWCVLQPRFHFFLFAARRARPRSV